LCRSASAGANLSGEFKVTERNDQNHIGGHDYSFILDSLIMKKIIAAGLLISSLFVYLEWGGGYHAFIIQGEWEMFSKALIDPMSALHPFVLLPLAGQIMLLYTLFQKEPGRRLTLMALGCLSILILFITFVGVISKNYKIVLSTLPFIAFGVATLRVHRRSNT
jgi:hypothetical protein